MSRLDKKQRNKTKREAKRKAARRMNSISPVKRLADTKGEIECWISDTLTDTGQAQCVVYKYAAGLNGIACFLIDRGVVGLKDAWTRTRIERAELDSMLDGCDQRGIPMEECSADEVRDLVAGGVRWAHENGMRLPKDWQKAAAFLGGVGDWKNADVSDFIMEFAGHPNDLRQRLVNAPFEEYIQREDIDFTFSDAAPYMDQETGNYNHRLSEFDDSGDEMLEDEEYLPAEDLNKIAEQFTAPATALAIQTSDWLKPHGEVASPELFEAWRSMMVSIMLSKAAMPNRPEKDVNDFCYELLEDMSSRIGESRADEHDRAVDQVMRHLLTNGDMMREAVVKYGLMQTTDNGDPKAEQSKTQQF